MQRRLEPHGKVNFNQLLLRFERDKYTVTLFADGRALVQGTTDVTVARSLVCPVYWQLRSLRPALSNSRADNVLPTCRFPFLNE